MTGKKTMYKFIIKGIVQGVGFRPYVFNACTKAGLKGYVQNIGEGVVIEADDKETVLEILKTPPPLARIDSIDIAETNNVFSKFEIKTSSGNGFAEIPADLFLCNDCLTELRDQNNRRYGYFFITCTNCGPRFTITRNNPYDRHTTTMDEFPMCDQCKTEYTDPSNRRYHAQTIACHDCGPKLSLINNNTTLRLAQGDKNDAEAIAETAELIKNGNIVAIKGIGGFHLACNTKPETVEKLKHITGRKHKPFSLICRNLKMAEKIVNISEKEKLLLEANQRPIVVLKKKLDNLHHISELDTLGIMLPYTALHYLLFDHLDEPIIMTSSNQSGEPITTLKGQQIVNYILDHNRSIENPADDSLIKLIENKIFYLRRSRGYVPQSIPVAKKSKKQILAMGAELNNTFAVYKNGRITPSQYIGNTGNVETFNHYKKTIAKFIDFTKIHPDLMLCDLHPEYNTSHYAEKLSKELGIELQKIQHHHAHAYSVAAEHDLNDFVAIVCDGLGYGEDNTVWGGEIFHNNQRVGHLEQHRQIGGDSAATYPLKMVFSILRKFLSLEDTKKVLHKKYSDKEFQLLDQQLTHQINSPLTSSCGRILDAAAALLNICNERTYEGRPAMLLEAFSTTPLPLKPVIKDNILQTTPLFEFLIENLTQDKSRLAATVQQYLAEGLYGIASRYNKPVTFSGGCAYNRIMSSYLVGKGVLVNKKIPAGDGGISFGQIAYYLANPRDDIA